MLRNSLFLLFGFLLAACGAGGGSTGFLSVSPGGTSTNSGTEYYAQVARHNSGKRAFLGNEVEDGEMKAFAALVPSESMLNFIYTGQDDGSAVNILYDSYYGSTPYGTIRKSISSNKGRSYDSYYFFDNNSGQKNYFISSIIDAV